MAHAFQNCAGKSQNHYMFFDWGPIDTLMICLNAVVGMCAEWHSDDGANTGSMSKGHAAPLSSPVLLALPRGPRRTSVRGGGLG